MADELAKLEPGILEQIAKDVGSNLDIEKAAIQGSVVNDNLYETAMKSSELLLRISGEMIGAIGGNLFSADLRTHCRINGCSSKLVIPGRSLAKIVNTHNEFDCSYHDNTINIMPKKGKISIAFPNHVSPIKAGALGAIAAGSFVAGCLIFPPYSFLQSLFTLLLPSGILVSALPRSSLSRQVYGDKEFFYDTSEFAFRHSNKTTDAFVREYLSLPDRLYGVVGKWIEQNKSSMAAFGDRQNEYNLLEKKLR